MELNELLKPKQRDRLVSIQLVIDGKLTLKAASESMGISYRQAKRLKKAVETLGPKAMLHGNLGRKSKKALDRNLQQQIVQYARSLYADLNDTQIAEKLISEQQIDASRETIRRILRKHDLGSRKDVKRLRRMNRSAHDGREGETVLWGGCRESWFGPQQAECCFMAALDMTTMKCLAAFFCAAESSGGYLRLLKKIVTRFGLPEKFCQHSRNAVRREAGAMTLHEQLRGGRRMCQVERALAQLGIGHIHEKKRRIVRILETLQRDLRREIRQAGIQCIAAGNTYLKRQFIYDFNLRHAYGQFEGRPAWRTVPAGLDLNRVCSHCYEAVVDSANTVTVEGVTIKIPPGPDRISYARACVSVHRFLSGLWCVYYGDKKIATMSDDCFQELKHRLFTHGHQTDTGPVAAEWVYRMYTASTQQSESDFDEVALRR